jgi:hypothetical protein
VDLDLDLLSGLIAGGGGAERTRVRRHQIAAVGSQCEPQPWILDVASEA